MNKYQFRDKRKQHPSGTKEEIKQRQREQYISAKQELLIQMLCCVNVFTLTSEKRYAHCSQMKNNVTFYIANILSFMVINMKPFGGLRKCKAQNSVHILK